MSTTGLVYSSLITQETLTRNHVKFRLANIEKIAESDQN